MSPSLFAGSPFLELTVYGNKVIRQWNPPIIRWRYNPNGAPANIGTIIQTALNTWKVQTQSTVEFDFAGTTSNSTPRDDGYCDFIFNANFSGLGISQNVIAVTFRNGSISNQMFSGADRFLQDGDVIVNPIHSSSWITSVPTDPAQLDLQEIILHEAGHVLGVAHSFLIDSVMYPAKPESSASSILKALYRVPKRSLSQDDSATLSALYPNSSFARSTSRIEGRVLYNGEPYIGAHVIAAKLSESDLQMSFYPSDSTGDLIVRGIKNVSAFSEEGGVFKIEGLEAGSYVVGVQDASRFLNFSLVNTTEYLVRAGSSQVLPTAFYSTNECADGTAVTNSNLSVEYNSAASLPLTAGNSFCSVDIQAKTGQNFCSNSPYEDQYCGGGGCRLSMDSEFFSKYIGLILSVVGVFIILFSLKARINRKK